MHPKLLKQKNFIKLTLVYICMAVTIIFTVTLMFMFVLGYRFDKSSGHIEQYALLQFNSSPPGATVSVNGAVIGSQTPNKTSVPAGSHDITIKQARYHDWKKAVNVKSATMTWLNYAILVPSQINVEPITNYESIHASLASPTKLSLIIHEKPEVPVFDLIDLSADTPKSKKISIPANIYTDSANSETTHEFKLVKWDSGSRYVLVNHIYGDKNEWLVVDTQVPDLTKNITQLFNIAINDIYFSGTNGSDFYILSSNDVRKLNLSAGTISRPFVSNVSSFGLYEANVIAYTGSDKDQQVVGVYRDGDETPYVLRKIDNKDVALKITTARYFNEDYVAIAEGKKVDVLRGKYPNKSNDTTSLKIVDSFNSKNNIQNLGFSPAGGYILAQSGSYFVSYDLENQKMNEASLDGGDSVLKLKWLDDNYVWSGHGGVLSIREFDGANAHKINPVLDGQDAVMTHNKRFIYSINKMPVGYQLQRVRMILL